MTYATIIYKPQCDCSLNPGLTIKYNIYCATCEQPYSLKILYHNVKVEEEKKPWLLKATNREQGGRVRGDEGEYQMTITDTDRLDFLQTLTDRHVYTGRVILRDSTSGRGWRLHETDYYESVSNVRKAIDNYMEAHEALTEK